VQSARPTHSRGFSLVELMVGMLIGLIGMIIIFQVFEVSEGIKRTTTSGGDAQQNGAIALFAIESDLRNAGAGFNDTGYAGCNIAGSDTARSTPSFNMLLVPALLCAPDKTSPGGACPGGGAASAPNTLTLFYGSQAQTATTQLVTTLAAPGTGTFSVKNTFGYAQGDLVVLLEPLSGKNCALMEVTQVGDPVAGSNVIFHVSGSYAGNNARFNSVSPGVSYQFDPIGIRTTRVYNLGNLYTLASGYNAAGAGAGVDVSNVKSAIGKAQIANLPVNNTYAIDLNTRTLTVTSAFIVDPATGRPLVTPVADNIVQLQAQYGLDDGVTDGSVPFNPAAAGAGVPNDGLVDRFVSAATFNTMATPPWNQVIAVRVAVVARSALAEKPRGSDGQNCDATTDGTEATPGPDQRPRWSGSLAPIDVSASGDPSSTSPLYWKCYRYRVFETTVPLRNWIWKAS